MGIRFSCPQGHKLHVKEHLAGKRAVCPSCGTKLTIPLADSADTPSAATSSVEPPPSFAETPSVVIRLHESPAVPPIEPAPISAAELPTAAPPVVGAEAANVPSLTTIAIQHRNRRRTQAKISIALFVVAVVLGIVLIWVLTRPAEPEVLSESSAAARVAPSLALDYAADGNVSAST